METKPDIATYWKPVKSGGYRRRRVVFINFNTGAVQYLQDTEDQPNELFQTTVKAFRSWMKGVTEVSRNSAYESTTEMSKYDANY